MILQCVVIDCLLPSDSPEIYCASCLAFFTPHTFSLSFFSAGAPQIQKLMTVMISLHEKFFPKTNDQPPEPASQKNDSKMGQLPRSSVGWDAAEESFSPSGDPPKAHGVKCLVKYFQHYLKQICSHVMPNK